MLNRHQTGDTDSVQPVILLPVQRDSQETFIPCEARMLWYSADRTSSQQLRDTTKLIVIIDEKVNYDYIVFMSLAHHFEALIPKGLSIGSDTQPRWFMEDTAMGD